jgi:hypothetical protein
MVLSVFSLPRKIAAETDDNEVQLKEPEGGLIFR